MSSRDWTLEESKRACLSRVMGVALHNRNRETGSSPYCLQEQVQTRQVKDSLRGASWSSIACDFCYSIVCCSTLQASTKLPLETLANCSLHHAMLPSKGAAKLLPKCLSTIVASKCWCLYEQACVIEQMHASIWSR